MDWIGIATGMIGTMFLFALISDREEEDDLELDSCHTDNSDLIVNDSKGRSTTLYCESCRKQKRHAEIERDLWQCTRCKRHTDLRAASSYRH